MSLIKLAKEYYHYLHNQIDADYDDKRSFYRRNKGKIWGISLGLPLVPAGPLVGGLIGMHADHKRKVKDFKRKEYKDFFDKIN